MTIKNLILAGIAGFTFFSSSFAAEKFDIVPLYGIKVHYTGLTYKSVQLKTHDAGAVVDNRMPQHVKFSIEVQKPQGFKDSSGYVQYGLRFGLYNQKKDLLSYSPDIFNGTGNELASYFESVSLSLSFDEQTAPGTELTVVGRVFDRKDTLNYIQFEYKVTVIAASKRLPTRGLTYSNQDSRGMKSNGVGLHFNFFEFKGLEGNHFIYLVKPLSQLKFSLRGLEGWKVVDDKVKPVAEIVILDENGKELETITDVLPETMSSERKELEFKFKPTSLSASATQYFVWVKLRDGNSDKIALDVVIKVYTE